LNGEQKKTKNRNKRRRREVEKNETKRFPSTTPRTLTETAVMVTGPLLTGLAWLEVACTETGEDEIVFGELKVRKMIEFESQYRKCSSSSQKKIKIKKNNESEQTNFNIKIKLNESKVLQNIRWLSWRRRCHHCIFHIRADVYLLCTATLHRSAISSHDNGDRTTLDRLAANTMRRREGEEGKKGRRARRIMK
jgi:hypothetical protein